MPRTRADVYSESNADLAEEELQKLLAAFDKRMQRLNEQYMRLMGEHIRAIGEMWPSDVHRLEQIRRMNKNLSRLQRQIARQAGAGMADIQKIFERMVEVDSRMAEKILGRADVNVVTDNSYLRRILEAQYRETAGSMKNLSNTTVVSDRYRDAIDEAVSAVQSGTEDYGSAIRRVIREAGGSGLQLKYESGHRRRLDTAARMNVLDGVRHINQNIMNALGEKFGADGVEIDAHMLCAEDHMPYQGGQYSNAEFEEIQDGLQRPFGEWNCRHSWHPILLGISPPTYTGEQLREMREYSTEQIEIDGKTKTRYQWSQEMRRIEAAVRQQKDTATLARYSGDTKLRQECQGNVLRLQQLYRNISGQSGLKTEFGRTYVAGFKDVKVGSEENTSGKPVTGLTESAKDANIKESELGKFKEHLRADEHIDKSYYSTLKTKFSQGSDDAKAVFMKYVDGNMVADPNYTGPAHFDPNSKCISMNYAYDASYNSRGKGVTYFHEHGHLIDDLTGYKSHSMAFLTLLKNDVTGYSVAYGKEHNLKTWGKVDAAISTDLSEMRRHSAVSDLFGAITRGNVQGCAGHKSSYWTSESITEEAFAHMFECQFDDLRHAEMRKYFPTALEHFESSIMKGLLE